MPSATHYFEFDLTTPEKPDMQKADYQQNWLVKFLAPWRRVQRGWFLVRFSA
ncbi:MAG: hypothetical protein M9920_08515 [Verrucomicrobiae bacterium]|nr:hypothetical protein [Verrucomicrobiae bacterium]